MFVNVNQLLSIVTILRRSMGKRCFIAIGGVWISGFGGVEHERRRRDIQGALGAEGWVLALQMRIV